MRAIKSTGLWVKFIVTVINHNNVFKEENIRKENPLEEKKKEEPLSNLGTDD